MGTRCYACETSLAMARELESLGPLAGYDADETCQTPQCVRTRWNESRFCAICISLVGSKKRDLKWRSITPSHELSLRKRIRGHRKPCPLEWWPTKKRLASRHKDLLFLNLEFSFNKLQIYSIGIVDVEGRTFCHILLDYSQETLSQNEAPIHPYLRRVNEWYRQRCQDHTQGRFTHVLTPAEAIEYLRTFIVPDTVLIGWGLHDLDLRMLRKWADHYGSCDFLPQENSSPAGIPLAKKVLPGLPSYSMAFIFRALFSNDTLVEHAHLADADALMCFKVVTYLLEAYQEDQTLPSVGKLQSTLPSWSLSITPGVISGRRETSKHRSKAADKPNEGIRKSKRSPNNRNQQSLNHCWDQISTRQTRSKKRNTDHHIVNDYSLNPIENEHFQLRTSGSGDSDSGSDFAKPKRARRI